MEEFVAAQKQVGRAWEWFHGMVALSATNTGIELGLFGALQAEGALTPADLAACRGLEARPVETWAKTLVQHGLLEADGDRVRMAPGVESMVCDNETLLYTAPSIRYHARFLARDFLEIPDYLRDGVARPPSRHGPALVRNIAAQTAAMHAMFVGGVLPDLPRLREALAGPCAILDAGCGTGTFGELLCRMLDRVRYTGIDPDATAIEMGRSRLAESPVADRVDLVHGRVEGLGRPGEFDLAFLFLTLHEIPEAERAGVFGALHRALRGGGTLAVIDETYPGTLAEAAEPAASMGLHFEYTEMVWGSRVPRAAEIEDLAAEAGFSRIETEYVLGEGLAVVLASA